MAVPPGKLTLDASAAPDIGQAAAIGEATAAIMRDSPRDITGYTRKVPTTWIEAGRRWLGTDGWTPDTDAIVPTLGAHPAIMAVIAALTAPGDRIVFEELTYSSIARSANLIGRRAIGVAMDADGLDPEEFERTCAQQHPKLAFLIPGLHNPTLTIMSEARRRALVEIARQHNVWLIEDAIYAALLDAQPPPIAALAPERTFHVSSLSKSVSAGIRGGWVACPPHFAPRVMTAYKMLTGGNPFLLCELAARLVLSGAAQGIRAGVKREIAARAAMVRAGFDGYDFAVHPECPFLWMKLPEPWLSGTFKHAAAEEGVLIDDEDEYKCGRGDRIFHRVRIAFSGPNRAGLAEALTRLRSLLDNRIAGYTSYG
jgi:DNA-binding transcriptional MocR family regulator